MLSEAKSQVLKNHVSTQLSLESFLRAMLFRSDIDVLNYILHADNKYALVILSQSKMIKNLGLSRSTIYRAIQRLMGLGLLWMKNQGYKKACLFKVSPIFHRNEYRERLRHMFSAFKWLSVRCLNPIVGKFVKVGDTLLSRVMNYNIYNGLSRDTADHVFIPTFLLDSAVDHPTTQKGREMNTTQPIPEIIRTQLGFLNLSKWGQIALTAFPNEAIDYAIKAYRFASPQDPFKWFYAVCMEYCKIHDIKPDFATVNTLKSELRQPENARMTLDKTLKRENLQISPKDVSYSQSKEEDRRTRLTPEKYKEALEEIKQRNEEYHRQRLMQKGNHGIKLSTLD